MRILVAPYLNRPTDSEALAALSAQYPDTEQAQEGPLFTRHEDALVFAVAWASLTRQLYLSSPRRVVDAIRDANGQYDEIRNVTSGPVNTSERYAPYGEQTRYHEVGFQLRCEVHRLWPILRWDLIRPEYIAWLVGPEAHVRNQNRYANPFR
jgi:hypothetical protein